MENSTHWLKPGILIGALGIVATFLATFSGVFLANSLQEANNQKRELKSYKSLVAIMHADCVEILNLNKDLDPIDRSGKLRQPIFLFSSALQNSLLFEHMERKHLLELIRSLSRSSYYGQKYQQYVSLHPSGIIPLPSPSKQGETYADHQKRIRQEVEVFRKERMNEARQFHNKYVTESEGLCKMLSAQSQT
jgi:hypothetical protein